MRILKHLNFFPFLAVFLGSMCDKSKQKNGKKEKKVKDRFKENLFQFKVQARNTRRNKLKIMFVKKSCIDSPENLLTLKYY